MRTFITTTRAFALMIALGFALLTSGIASAHAEFVSSTPAPDSTLTVAPSTVVIAFSEELNADGNTITVKDAAGAQVDNGDTALDKSDADRKTVMVSLKSGLGEGKYTVDWKNSSADGHAEEGSYSFTVKAVSPSNPSKPTTLPTTSGESLPLGLLLAGALALLGVGVVLRRVNAR